MGPTADPYHLRVPFLAPSPRATTRPCHGPPSCSSRPHRMPDLALHSPVTCPVTLHVSRHAPWGLTTFPIMPCELSTRAGSSSLRPHHVPGHVPCRASAGAWSSPQPRRGLAGSWRRLEWSDERLLAVPERIAAVGCGRQGIKGRPSRRWGRAAGLRGRPRGDGGQRPEPGSPAKGRRPQPGEGPGAGESGAGATGVGCQLRTLRSCVSFPTSLRTSG